MTNEKREGPQPVYDLDSVELNDPNPELEIDNDINPDMREILPEGRYAAQLAVDESNGSGITQATSRRGDTYYTMHLVANIVAAGEAVDGMRVWDSRSTLRLGNSATCPLMAVARARKIKVPARIPKLELVRLVKNDLESRPLVGIEVQWQCRYQGEDGTWKTLRKGMKNFPAKLNENGEPTGRYIPEVEAPDGQFYSAKPVIVKYMPVEEVR